MAWPPVLVRYGEIGIKSRAVRVQFEKRLQQRVEEQLVRRSVEAEIAREQGRLVVRASDVDLALEALAHTFGVVSASATIETDATPEAVAELAFDHARRNLPQGGSFAMRVKRAGSHAFTSLDVAKRAASRILEGLPDRAPRVDLDAPDIEMHAEVREGRAYFLTRTVRGPGGLPLGSQGKVGVLVDGPRAAHAAWLLGKRGSALVFLARDPAAGEAWLAPLRPWVPEEWRVHPVEGIADVRLALERHHCHALVRAGGAQEAVAEQAEDAALGFPVFRPLVGYAAERLRALARLAELPEDV